MRHRSLQPDSRAPRLPVFRRVLLLTATAAIAAACGSTSTSPPSQGHGAHGGGSSTSTTGNGTGSGGTDGGVTGTDGGAVVVPTSPTVVISGAGSVTMSPRAFGQNYWDWGAYSSNLPAIQSGVTGMKLNVLRAGGANNDTNSPKAFDTAQIDAFVAYAKAVGAEPILQVPLLKDTTGNAASPSTAAAMVTYANVTKSYGIKYWEIGNEPDLYPTTVADAGYTVDAYATSFLAYAAAMKAVDATIQIMGPELSWMYIPGNDWLSPFLDKCAPAVDIVSVHRYPFDAPLCTIDNAMADGQAFQRTVTALRATMAAHGAGSKPLAITEANFSWNGDPTKATTPAALGTFYAGLWVADNLGIALEQQLWTVAYWSLDEGWMTGFFGGTGNAPRPAVYAQELFSNHFGPTILHATTVPAGFSAYGSRDDARKNTTAIILNRTAQDAEELVSFQGLSVTPKNQLLPAPAYSITLVQVPDDGSAPTVLQYTKAMSDQGKGPQPITP